MNLHFKIFLFFLIPISFYCNNLGLDTINNDSIKPIVSRNVIYFNIPNEIGISVPFAKKIEVYGNGISKIDNFGQYSIIIPYSKTEKYKLRIKAIFLDKSIENYNVILKVRKLGIPFVEINGKNGNQIIEFEELNKSKLTISIKDPFFDDYFKIKSFKVLIDEKVYSVIGNKFDEKFLSIISNAKTTDVLIFDVLFSLDKNNTSLRMCKLKPLKLRIENYE